MVGLEWFVLMYYNLKKIVRYKTDFLFSILASMCSVVMVYLGIYVIFNETVSLFGWSKMDMLFLYGFWQLSVSFYHLLWLDIQNVPNYVKSGEFQNFLLRPVNSLVYVSNNQLSINGLGEIVAGFLIIYFSAPSIFTFINILLLIIFVVTANLINLSFQIILSSLTFWVGPTNEAHWYLWGVWETSKYPIEIYNKFIKLLVIIIPFSFTCYFPAALLLNKENGFIGYFSPLVAILMFLLATKVWNRGVSRYESAGG